MLPREPSLWELAGQATAPSWNFRVKTQDVEAPARIALELCPTKAMRDRDTISYYTDGSHFENQRRGDNHVAAWAIIR
eukprot:2986525-Pyramimonas_sp.AAC.1